MKSETAKAKLNDIIAEMARHPSLFVEHPGKDFTRDRKLPFETMLKIIIGMNGGSIQKELYSYDKSIDVTSSAFVQQRDKILPETFGYIFRQFTDLLAAAKNYRGYRLLAVDGSTISLALNENAETYMPNGYCGSEFNAYHMSALYDLCNKFYIDTIVELRSTYSEYGAAIKMIDRNTFGKAIIIADRGYPGVNLIEHINRKPGLKFVLRTKNDWIKEIKEMPIAEFDTDVSFELRTTQTKIDKELYKKGKAKFVTGLSKYGKEKKEVAWDFESPFRMSFRVVRFKISDTGNDRNDYETIVTSLDRAEFPAEEIKKLYHFRWGIETSFRDLKYPIELTRMHTKKDKAALQEIYARLLMYNFCMCITMDVIVEQKDTRKYVYQVNITHAIYLCKDYFRCHDPDPPDIESLIGKWILPVRPGRSDRRKAVLIKSFVPFVYRVS